MKQLKIAGVTLIEILLVLVIATTIISLLITYTTQSTAQARRDRIVTQMQQIMSAALAYYAQNGKWPANTISSPNGAVDKDHDLVKNNYLQQVSTSSNGAVVSPYGVTYYTFTSQKNLFYVITSIPSSVVAEASVIAGQLPSGVTLSNASATPSPPYTPSACTSSNKCIVAASVAPPGQNLNNARSVNFANLYKSGQCVPVPYCPPGMTSQIYAVPAGVSGIADGGSTPNSSAPSVYPVSSYTAYAMPFSANPANCIGTSAGANANCASSNVTGGNNNNYWRVCLAVMTERGAVQQNDSTDAQNIGTILVITRCLPGNSSSTYEPTGSPSFTVYN